jgi:hypothetical protein
VSEPTYTITINEAERASLAYTLSLLVAKLTNAKIEIDSPYGETRAARTVPSPQRTPAAAAPIVPVVEQRDRWARDRRGKELPHPEGCATREVLIWKTEQKTAKGKGGKPGMAFLKVTWESQDRGHVDANCFDSQLFPWLINQSGKRTTLYLVKSGDYLNVVGVRA